MTPPRMLSNANSSLDPFGKNFVPSRPQPNDKIVIDVAAELMIKNSTPMIPVSPRMPAAKPERSAPIVRICATCS